MGKIIYLDARRGKLILCSKSNYYKYIGDEYFYAASYKYEIFEDVTYMEELAPSLKLKEYISQCNTKEYTNQKQKEYFTQQYKKELKQKSKQKIIKRLKDYLENGKTIILFGEEDENFNFIKILKEIFESSGYRVYDKQRACKPKINIRQLF